MFCCTKLSAGLAAAAKAACGVKRIAAAMTKGQIRLPAQNSTIRREYEFMKLSYNSCGTYIPKMANVWRPGSFLQWQYPQLVLKIWQILNLGCAVPDFIIAGLAIKATHRS